MNGLDSLKRHQKCMRVSSSRIYRAAMKGAKNKTKAKRAEVKAAASAVARVACAVTVGSRRRAAPKRSKKGSRRSSRRSGATTTFNPPDFSRNLLTRTPPQRETAYDDNWGY